MSAFVSVLAVVWFPNLQFFFQKKNRKKDSDCFFKVLRSILVCTHRFCLSFRNHQFMRSDVHSSRQALLLVSENIDL